MWMRLKMTNQHIKDKEREGKKRQEEERRRSKQHQISILRTRSLHEKHKERRKRDCMIGLPLIIAFHGDPARMFFCADYPTSYELIPRTSWYPKRGRPWERIKQYTSHHITSISLRVLVYKAGEKIYVYDPKHKCLIDVSCDNAKLKKLARDAVRVM